MIFKELIMGGFWYFDVLRMSGVWNFAFQIWSIYCTMQRAEYSYTLRHIQSLNWMGFAGVSWYLVAYSSVWCSMEMWVRCLMSFSMVTRVLFMDVFWVPLRVTHASGQSEKESRPGPKGAKQDWIGDQRTRRYTSYLSILVHRHII